MHKLLASIKKESLIVLNDRAGLLLMYLMPIMLVFIITLVQDSSFRMVSENQVRVLIVNDDLGDRGDSLIQLLQNSGSFKLTVTKNQSPEEMQRQLLDENRLLAIHIPANFSKQLLRKASQVTDLMLTEFGVKDSINDVAVYKMDPLTLYYDPVLQENYRFSISSSIYAYLGSLENGLVMENLYKEMGYDRVPASIKNKLANERIAIVEKPASGSNNNLIPNATQHNVPAWSIFAMFFMVVSLGGNIVKERLNGSFVRLRTMPTGFSLILFSKMMVYLFVAMTQLMIIMLIGIYVFPLIGLQRLVIPDNYLAVVVVSLFAGFAAVSYATLIGTYAKTLEQANGVGAISIIIFAAIGGIWVPSFVMPAYLQSLGQISPLYWCLKGFYVLFLQGGAWKELQSTLLFLGLFSFGCQVLVFLKLKVQGF